MTNLNSNITNKYLFAQQNPSFKSTPIEQTIPVQEQTMPEVQLPDIYYSPNINQTKSFKETVKQVDMMNMVYPWLEHPLLMLGICTGLGYGVDKFSKACGGEYEKSLVGKAGKLGDKIQNSKFVQSKPIQSIIKGTRNAKIEFCKFFKNSDLINAIRKTPSSPEWSMCLDEMSSMQQRQVHEFNRLTNILKLTSDGVVDINEIGLEKADKKFLKDFFKSNATSEQIVNAVQLKRLGLSDSAIKTIVESSNATELVKAETFKKLGTTKEALVNLQNCKNITEAEIKAVEEMCAKAKSIKVGQGKYKWLGPFQPFARTIGFDELYNRIHSMRSGAKTGTGKALATFLQKCHRGFTFGGGKLGVLAFVSPIIAETIIDTIKADPKEKVGTAAHGGIHAISWVFTFPLALQLMHHLAGAQYAGMSKDKVEACRELIRNFNKDVDAGLLNDKAKYDKRFKELTGKLKELRKVKGQNLLTKISKQIGRFVTMDLENIKSYRGGNFFGNTLRKIPSFFRNLGGIPMRFAIWGGISMGIFDALINKGIKSTFGNFYDRYKEEEFEANKKQQKEFLKKDLQDRLMEAQKAKVLGTNTVAQATENQITEEINEQPKEIVPKDVIKETQEKITETKTEKNNTEQIIPPIIEKTPTQEIKPIKQQYLPNEKIAVVNEIKPQSRKIDNYTYIPSSENVLAKTPEEKLKYIPSQEGVKFTKTFNNSGLESALSRADRAEQKALRTLAGNFE